MEDLREFRELEPNDEVIGLMTLIEESLPLFVDSKEFIDITNHRKNETHHTQAFCAYMTNLCRSRFYFERETAQKGSSAIDIGVRSGAVLIFTIEAKILPTPKGSKKKPRNDYEYVHGLSGGIQRFKDGKHGLDNSQRPFRDCGMIAYVKQNSFEHWHETLNAWIAAAKWSDSEKLIMIRFGKVAKLRSRHLRRDGNELILHHFWVMVTGNSI